MAASRTLATLASALIGFTGAAARAAEEVTYLFPAPDTLPAFAPFQIARAGGYYAEEGLAVTFQVGKGGADVAKQVAVGNAELGGGSLDTVLAVRANGLPVRAVANLGTGSLYQVITREDAGVARLEDLKGKRVGVIGFQDSGFYNLQGALSTVGLTRDDVAIEAVGVPGIAQLVSSGALQAAVSVPDSVVAIRANGAAVASVPISRYFPSTAQAVLASEDVIAERPELVSGFVRATLRAVREIAADPARAADAYVEAVPRSRGQEAQVADVMRLYAELVYAPDKGVLGAYDAAHVARMARFYVEAEIIAADTGADAFTNDFVPR